jgi:hypothetical protein
MDNRNRFENVSEYAIVHMLGYLTEEKWRDAINTIGKKDVEEMVRIVNDEWPGSINLDDE